MTALEKTISEFGYSSVNEFAKEHAKLTLMGKIEKCQIINTFFEKKYNQKFIEFQVKLDSQENCEDFEKEDDYLDWRFALEEVQILKEELKELQNC